MNNIVIISYDVEYNSDILILESNNTIIERNLLPQMHIDKGKIKKLIHHERHYLPTTIDAKLSSNSTKSAASLATSLPFRPIATPIAACCNICDTVYQVMS